MAKRRPISQLPAINRTATLERFFGSTVDHLFQPGKTSAISGYIGRTPAYNNPEVDFYKSEPTSARRKYQLEATMVSQSGDGTLNDVLFYDDLISGLSAQGALVSDLNRLFKSEYWSWAPPIDIDKINNFQRYYWSGDDVPSVELTLPGMEIPTISRGNGEITIFPLPATQQHWNILPSDRLPALEGDGDFPGCPIALVNGVSTRAFSLLDNNTVEFDVAPADGSSVELYRYGNIGDGTRKEFAVPRILHNSVGYNASDVHVYVDGRPTLLFQVVGDRVVLNTAPARNTLVTVTIFDSLKAVITGRPSFNIAGITKQPVTELVNGLRVRLIDPYTVFFGFDIKASGTFKWDERRPDLYLVDGVGTSIRFFDLSMALPGLDPQYAVVSRLDSALSYFSRANRWVQAEALRWFGGDTVGRQAKRPICEHLPDMAMWNYGRTRAPDVDIVYGVHKPFNRGSMTNADDFGREPAAGDVVLFGDVGNPAINNKIFLWPVVDDRTDPANIVMVFLANARVHDVVLHTGNRLEWWFNGLSWTLCDTPGLFPLFDLFDNNGVSVGDQGEYPGSDFAGSRIFNYKVGVGANETLLGFPVEHDTYGEILFENDLYTHSYRHRDGEIEGFLYYQTGANRFDNQWYKSSVDLPSVGSTPRLVTPLNLQANPNMGTPQIISRNNWFDHFASIVANQTGFSGKPYSINNWQSTARDLSRGNQIVQARSPMLKLMMLLSDNILDFTKALKFAETEYARYKLKVRQSINEKHKRGLLIRDMDEDAEIVAILEQIAANRTSEFAFFLSDMGGGNYFIPMTPAALGITAMVRPHFTVENGVSYLVGHDGSKTASIDEITDRLLFAFEQRIFDARKDEVYRAESRPLLDEIELFSGKYRSADYSRRESNVVQQAAFEEWARSNNVGYQANTSFDISNPFTWNYGALTDRDDAELPGNWRGIYRWYFDTETPHLTPWEMLGFGEEPEWWQTFYGKAPYRRNNASMWNDLSKGIIRSGPREGIDLRFQRPDLMAVLPVGANGELLDPLQARIVETAPTQQFAAQNWVFGDNGPVENLWRRSSSYGFAKAGALFLMRPAQFVEDYWDRDERLLVHGSQWIDKSTNDRAAHSELVVHGERLDDGSQKISYGIQTWLVEHLIHQGQTPEYLGEMLRGLDVRLAHKMAGFTTRDRLSVDAESFGPVPADDIKIELYRSPGLSVDFYSGIIIEHLGPSRWRVIGYNSVDPYFDIQPCDRNGRKIMLTGQQERVVNPWHPNVYYKVGMFVLHEGAVYEAIRNHQSMSFFEKGYWRVDGSGIGADERLFKYLGHDGTSGRIPYTTVMHSRQDVVDFIYGYERDLGSRGFAFDEGVWDDAATKFINWSGVEWAAGSFLTLSPGARNISFKTPQGYVLNLEGPNATGSIINRTGHLIDDRKTKVDRLDDTVTITATGDDIYGVALRRGEIEHILVFANRTIFNDIIYDTTFNVRQERLKIHARRTEDWNGRYDAPGFIISDGQIVTNFEKSAEDLRYMFDIELADNTVLRDHARHVIGFENRPYLSGLLLNETQQFELYQGMIQQKGAMGAFDKIMRSRIVEGNRELQFMEEWAFRVGEFGANRPRAYMEFLLFQGDMRRQQQVVRFSDTDESSQPGILTIAQNDARWVTPPSDFSELVTTPAGALPLPDAGYVRTTEATYMAPNADAFTQQVTDILKDGGTFAARETVWLYDGDGNGRWAIKHLFDASNVCAETFSDHLGTDPNWTINSGFVAADGGATVVGNGEKSTTHVMTSKAFDAEPNEAFAASMQVHVARGFNGLVSFAIQWSKADGSPCSDQTVFALHDHRASGGAAVADQREDLTPKSFMAPADAATGKVRITVEFGSIGAAGPVTVSRPIVQRALGNFTRLVENHNSNDEVTGTRFWMDHGTGLRVGDTVLIAGPVGSNYDASGIFTVADVSVNEEWFEIDTGDETGVSYDFESVEEIGPKVFRLLDGRFRVRAEAVGFPVAGALLYVDDATARIYDDTADRSSAKWAVFSDIDPTSLIGHVKRQQPPQMNTGQLASALIYDQETITTTTAIKPQPVTLSRIIPIDPIMGVVAGEADKEIDYKLEYDPAEYGDTDAALWTDAFVGRLWWDLSTVWFLNPYTDVLDRAPAVALGIGDLEVLAAEPGQEYLVEPFSERYTAEINYRSSNWNKLAPGSSVDVYEWTRSLKQPDKTEFDLHPSGFFVQTTEFFGNLNKELPVYYFWVKNSPVVPKNTIGRKLDAKSCATMLADPSAAGLPWMAIISEKEMLVSGVRDSLNDRSTVVQLQLQLTDDHEAKPHTQWKMLRPGDAKSQPTPIMWNKLRDSLVGFDSNLGSCPSVDVHASARTGIAVDQSMFDAPKKMAARESFITMINYQLARRNLGAVPTIIDGKLNHNTPVQEYLLWSRPDGSRSIADLPPEHLYSTDEFGLPMLTNDPAQMDEWMQDAPLGTRVLLDNRHTDNPSWSVWEKHGVKNDDNYTVDIAKHYHHRVADLDAFYALAQNGGISYGEYVLIEHNAEYDGLWTVVQYEGEEDEGFALMAYLDGDEDDLLVGAVVGHIKVSGALFASYTLPAAPTKPKIAFKVVNAQTYRTTDFWEYVDWFADGFDEASAPVVVYANAAERNRHENPTPANLFVKLLDNGAGYWVWTVFDGEKWNVVAQQLGTVQLSNKFFQNSQVFGWDGKKYNFDLTKIYDRDGSFELRVLMEALLDTDILSDSEKNELWFSMINFIHSSHDQVDWAFKTSFMTLVGFNEALRSEPVAKRDNTQFILNYAEEVKPYHVTIRDFARSYAPNVEVADTTVSDFDKPGFYDQDRLIYRRLEENSPDDLAIMREGQWQQWLDNKERARRFRTTMKLDRVWFETDASSPSAADRIASFYQPTAGMKPKDLDVLLKLDYKGTVLDGSGTTKTVIGGTASDKVDINGEHDGRRGLALRDPRVAAKTPEDMIRLGAHDTILFRAKDRWGGGAPRSTITSHDVSALTEAHADLPVGVVARHVLIFADGIRQVENVNYVVDYLANNVRVALVRASGTRVQTITIHAFGYAGHTTILDQKYVVAETDDTVFAMAIPTSLIGRTFTAEVTRDGKHIASARGAGNTIVFATIRHANYVVTFYKGNAPSATTLKEVVLPVTSTGALTHDLASVLNELPFSRPLHSSIIVERNGLRLAPPLTYFVEQSTERVMVDDPAPVGDMRVIDDGGAVGTVTTVADDAFANADALIAANRAKRYVFWRDRIVFCDVDAAERRYTVVINNTGDFTISDAGLLATKNNQPGDALRVLYWRNDAIMRPQTWSFAAHTSGTYRIQTRGRNGSSWLTLGGRRLVENIDYFVNPVVQGAWDTNAYETFRWDDLTEIDITIKNKLVGDSSTIVITTFEGVQSTPAGEWQHAALTPDLVRFKHVATTAEGERPFLKEDGAWATESHDLRREGGVTVAALDLGTSSFTIETNALQVPSLMLATDPVPVPDAKQQVPGVVWIGAERIEYFKRRIAGSRVTLDQVRRGTKGTPKMSHAAGSQVRVEHLMRQMPAPPSGDITTVPPVVIPDVPTVVFPATDRDTIVSSADPLFG